MTISSAAPARILVATDLSGGATEALMQAHSHALSVHGALGVCHVLPDSRVHVLFPQLYARESAEQAALDERARGAVVDRVASTTGRPPTSFEVFVEHGTDYAEIIRRAEEWNATLIAVGSHGTSGMRALLGSVAERVARYAHCPVLVARPPARRGLVVAATDLSTRSLPAIEAAVAEARRRSAKLVVLHVVDTGAPMATVAPSFGITPLVPAPEMLRQIRETARTHIDAALAKVGAHAESTIVSGPAAPMILKYVEDNPAELVVVGTRGWTGLMKIVLGSVAEHVLRIANTSVLVVRVAA